MAWVQAVDESQERDGNSGDLIQAKTRPSSARMEIWRGTIDRKFALKLATTSSEKQKENHDQQNKADAASAVVADTGAHVVAAATEQEQENDENHYQSHARKFST